jgi:hypothetical protein
MVKPCISVVASIEVFALCKDSLHPFHSYNVVFKVIVQLSISILFLVHATQKHENLMMLCNALFMHSSF